MELEFLLRAMAHLPDPEFYIPGTFRVVITCDKRLFVHARDLEEYQDVETCQVTFKKAKDSAGRWRWQHSGQGIYQPQQGFGPTAQINALKAERRLLVKGYRVLCQRLTDWSKDRNMPTWELLQASYEASVSLIHHYDAEGNPL